MLIQPSILIALGKEAEYDPVIARYERFLLQPSAPVPGFSAIAYGWAVSSVRRSKKLSGEEKEWINSRIDELRAYAEAGNNFFRFDAAAAEKWARLREDHGDPNQRLAKVEYQLEYAIARSTSMPLLILPELDTAYPTDIPGVQIIGLP